MNKLKYTGFAEETPVKVINGLRGGMKIYKGNILTYSVINENEGKVSIFGCYAQLIKMEENKNA